MMLSPITLRTDKAPVVSVGEVVLESKKYDKEEGDFDHVPFRRSTLSYA